MKVRFLAIVSALLVLLSGCGSGWGEVDASITEGGFSFWRTCDPSVAFTAPGQKYVITYMMKPKDIPII